MDAASVELRGVTRRLGGREVVCGVDLRVERGEFFSLLGPSGCGKTTTLRMVAGFEHPDAGTISIGGRDMAGVPPYRRDVNLVFQSYALFPHLSVRRNVAFGLEVRRVPRSEIDERVARALSLVRLEGLGDRRPDQLSGGQQQRVALARALVGEPSVLLLDEPMGALDPKLRREMRLELKHLQRRLGTTFLHVTHDQEEALALSDRLAVMDRGRVLQVGRPDEVYERPATRFVADFLGETNLLEGAAAGPFGDGLEVRVDGVALRAEGSAAPGARVTVTLRPEQIALRDAARGDLENELPCRVEEVVYAGAGVRYVVRTREGRALTVRTGPAAPLAVGTEAVAAFPASAARLVADDAP